jgi:hypothetical protein
METPRSIIVDPMIIEVRCGTMNRILTKLENGDEPAPLIARVGRLVYNTIYNMQYTRPSKDKFTKYSYDIIMEKMTEYEESVINGDYIQAGKCIERIYIEKDSPI